MHNFLFLDTFLTFARDPILKQKIAKKTSAFTWNSQAWFTYLNGVRGPGQGKAREAGSSLTGKEKTQLLATPGHPRANSLSLPWLTTKQFRFIPEHQITHVPLNKYPLIGEARTRILVQNSESPGKGRQTLVVTGQGDAEGGSTLGLSIYNLLSSPL